MLREELQRVFIALYLLMPGLSVFNKRVVEGVGSLSGAVI